MSDATGPMPVAGGPPDPPHDGSPPEPPADGPDWRVVVVATLTSLIVLLVLVLLLVRQTGDDGGDDVATVDRSTTTVSTASSTASSTTTSLTTTTTTTTSPTTSAPAPATSSTSRPTTSVAPSTTTIPPQRCTGRTGPERPGPVAEVFYDAWTVDDRSCAEEVASDEAIEDLFVFDGSQADWRFEGCNAEGSDPDNGTECFFRYEGGSASFAMTWDVVAGWEVTSVTFTVD